MIFLILILNFITIWSKRVVGMISVLLHLLWIGLCPIVWSILEYVLCGDEKNVYSVALVGEFYGGLLGPSVPMLS